MAAADPAPYTLQASKAPSIPTVYPTTDHQSRRRSRRPRAIYSILGTLLAPSVCVVCSVPPPSSPPPPSSSQSLCAHWQDGRKKEEGREPTTTSSSLFSFSFPGLFLLLSRKFPLLLHLLFFFFFHLFMHAGLVYTLSLPPSPRPLSLPLAVPVVSVKEEERTNEHGRERKEAQNSPSRSPDPVVHWRGTKVSRPTSLHQEWKVGSKITFLGPLLTGRSLFTFSPESNVVLMVKTLKHRCL